MMAVPVGLGVGGLYVCHKMNETTNEIAETIEELIKRLKDLAKVLDEMQSKDSGSNLDVFESIHDYSQQPDDIIVPSSVLPTESQRPTKFDDKSSAFESLMSSYDSYETVKIPKTDDDARSTKLENHKPETKHHKRSEWLSYNPSVPESHPKPQNQEPRDSQWLAYEPPFIPTSATTSTSHPKQVPEVTSQPSSDLTTKPTVESGPVTPMSASTSTLDPKQVGISEVTPKPSFTKTNLGTTQPIDSTPENLDDIFMAYMYPEVERDSKELLQDLEQDSSEHIPKKYIKPSEELQDLEQDSLEHIPKKDIKPSDELQDLEQDSLEHIPKKDIKPSDHCKKFHMQESKLRDQHLRTPDFDQQEEEDGGLKPAVAPQYDSAKTVPVDSRDRDVQPTTSPKKPSKKEQPQLHASDSFKNVHDNNECSGVFMPCILTTYWIHEVDRMLDGDDSENERAFNTLMDKIPEYPRCAELFWRLAKGAHHISSIPNQDNNKKRAFAFRARQYATRALEANVSNAEAHKWYAISLAAIASFSSLQEKITNACSFKKHVDIALSLRPDDPLSHHMLGKWCLEVSKMTWEDHKDAFVLCWCLLNATIADAVQHLTSAHELKPNWKHNILYLTKAHLENKDYNKALDLAKKGLLLPNNSEEDSDAHDELESIFKTISNYPTQSSHEEINLQGEP